MISLDKWYYRWLVSLLGASSFLLTWHLATGVFGLVGSYTLPSPVAVFEKYQATSDLIWSSIGHTLQVATVSFIFSLVLAIGMAILLSSNETIEDTLMPIVVSTNSVPRVSLAPMFIFYVGPYQSQYLLAAWVAFFPMLMTTFKGLSELDEDLEMLLDSLNATTWQRYKWVRMPNALPFIFDGMKLGVTLAIVGTIIVEYVSTGEGIGSLAALALGNYDTALGIAVVAVIGFISVGIFFSMVAIQSRVVHWKETSLYG